MFTYLCFVIKNNGRSHLQILHQIGLAHNFMDSLSMNIWQYLCKRRDIWIFKSFQLSHCMAVATDAFVNKCCRRIMGGIAGITLSNLRLLSEIDSKPTYTFMNVNFGCMGMWLVILLNRLSL